MISLLRTGRRGVKAAPFPYCLNCGYCDLVIFVIGNCLKRDLQDFCDFQDWGTCDESHDYEQDGEGSAVLRSRPGGRSYRRGHVILF